MASPSITVGNGKTGKGSFKSFFLSDKAKRCKTFENHFFGLAYPEYKSQEHRFDLLSDWAIAIFHQFNVTKVCLEGYAMNAKGQVFHIGENGGLLKHKMYKDGISFICPAPTQVKKFFAEKGNAKKDQMHESFVQKTEFDLVAILGKKADSSPVSDIVDSYAMYEFLLDNL